MITVKQYAEERGITIQAVHQSMNGKRKKDRLEGHVTVIDGIKWLDEEAVRILDEARNKAPVVYEKAEANQRIEELEANEKIMLAKIAAQADRIAELAEWKAEKSMVIAAADQTKLLLDTTKAELDQVKADNLTLDTENREIRENAQQAIQDAQEAQLRAEEQRQRAEAAEAKLAELEAMPKWKKFLIGWKGE